MDMDTDRDIDTDVNMNMNIWKKKKLSECSYLDIGVIRDPI